MPAILIVEDDSFLREGLYELFIKEGYDVICAANCTEACAQVSSAGLDMIILDVMLPDGSGFNLCTKWRKSGIAAPILFLTSCGDEIQIVRGLDAGGDDYITKPFRLRELLSRIRAHMRRGNINQYSDGSLFIDFSRMTLTKDGAQVYVTPTEFQLLLTLIRSGAVVSRGKLMRAVWDDAGVYVDDNTLCVHISRLREKVGPSRIATVRGVGYQWINARDEIAR